MTKRERERERERWEWKKCDIPNITPNDLNHHKRSIFQDWIPNLSFSCESFIGGTRPLFGRMGMVKRKKGNRMDDTPGGEDDQVSAFIFLFLLLLLLLLLIHPLPPASLFSQLNLPKTHLRILLTQSSKRFNRRTSNREEVRSIGCPEVSLGTCWWFGRFGAGWVDVRERCGRVGEVSEEMEMEMEMRGFKITWTKMTWLMIGGDGGEEEDDDGEEDKDGGWIGSR